MISTINSSDVLAFVGVITLCLALGGLFGRTWGTTKKRREIAMKITNSLDSTVQELMWAIGGKPADQWNPERSPGLIEQMGTLRTDQRKFESAAGTMFEQLLKRAERFDEATATSAAIAAKAVLDTASKASESKGEAAAVAAADVLATAIAAKLALVINKDT
jgi:hypothetical protein